MMFALTLAGVGRGLAASYDATGAAFGVPGVTVHICHSGPGDGSTPADPFHPECCDACALSASATLAAAPVLSAPASVAYYVEHARAMGWVPTLARFRTPRQSQGPPTA